MFKIGIFGLGAVGISIYKELNGYKELYALCDKKRIETYSKNKIFYNGEILNINYTDNLIMDLVIICVKNYQLKNSINDLNKFINSKTIILPMLNGIEAHDYLKSIYKYNRVLYGVINIEANKIDNKVIASKIINLQFGDEYNYYLRKPLMKIKKIFDNYNINNHIYHNMKRRMWSKWTLNIGINQISALYNYTYKDMSEPKVKEYLFHIFDEVFNVSIKYNIGLTLDDINDLKNMVNNFNSDRVTSLTVDFNKGGLNEIDSFGKKLLELADDKNVDVPYNKDLYFKLKEKDLNRK